MIIMPVPKDIRAIKAKFIGPFSKRQTMAVVPAGVIAMALFFTFGDSVSSDVLTGVIVLLDTPIIACGFIDIYGMPLWVFAKDVLIGRLLVPKARPYSTENTYAEYAGQNCISYEHFDGDTAEYTARQLKRKQKENKIRLEAFYKEFPESRPIQ